MLEEVGIFIPEIPANSSSIESTRSNIWDVAVSIAQKSLETEKCSFFFLFFFFSSSVRTPARTIIRESILWRTWSHSMKIGLDQGTREGLHASSAVFFLLRSGSNSQVFRE